VPSCCPDCITQYRTNARDNRNRKPIVRRSGSRAPNRGRQHATARGEAETRGMPGHLRTN
jgi:hypothetical protein